jgi:hypothetical protein
MMSIYRMITGKEPATSVGADDLAAVAIEGGSMFFGMARHSGERNTLRVPKNIIRVE